MGTAKVEEWRKERTQRGGGEVTPYKHKLHVGVRAAKRKRQKGGIRKVPRLAGRAACQPKKEDDTPPPPLSTSPSPSPSKGLPCLPELPKILPYPSVKPARPAHPRRTPKNLQGSQASKESCTDGHLASVTGRMQHSAQIQSATVSFYGPAGFGSFVLGVLRIFVGEWRKGKKGPRDP